MSTPSPSVSQIVEGLLSLATDRENEARRLREAAALLQGQPGADTPTANSHRRAGGLVSEEVYLEHLRRKPTAWSAGELYESLASAGMETNVAAVRTMLYRLEKRGLVKKVSPGLFVLNPNPGWR